MVPGIISRIDNADDALTTNQSAKRRAKIFRLYWTVLSPPIYNRGPRIHCGLVKALTIISVKLRDYPGALGPLVPHFEGTLDQFWGDGIMVFLNNPAPCPAREEP